jgi:phage gpG-like protein
MLDRALPMKGLLLDFGGVITRSFFETRIEFEALLGLPEEQAGIHAIHLDITRPDVAFAAARALLGLGL